MKILSLTLLALLSACPKSGDKKPTEPVLKKDAGSHTLAPDDATVQLPPLPPLPPLPAGLPGPPETPRIPRTRENIAFGELLFHDARLSTTGKHACATCHDPARGYAGPVAANAAGVMNLRRAPTLVNLAWVNAFGWDGRYPDLYEMLNAHVKGQLGQTIEEAIAPVVELPLYKAHLAHAGGSPHSAAILALAAFVLTRFEGDAPWDALEKTALSPRPGATPDPIVAGYLVFAGKGQCAVCHPPPLYTDGAFHRVVLDPKDPGHGFVDKDQTGAFRTPTLRGAMLRPALFHTGSAKTVTDVIGHYASARTTPGLDPALAKIALTPADQANLAAFLGALTKDRPAPGKPALP